MDIFRGGFFRVLFLGYNEIWNEGFCGRRRKVFCERTRINNKFILFMIGEELNLVYSSGR